MTITADTVGDTWWIGWGAGSQGGGDTRSSFGSPPLDPLVVTSLEWQAEVEQVQVPDAEATGHAWMPGGIPGDLYDPLWLFWQGNGD